MARAINAPLSKVEMFNDATRQLGKLISKRELMMPLLIEKRPPATVEIARLELFQLQSIHTIMSKLKYYSVHSILEGAINRAIDTEADYLVVRIAINDTGDCSKSNHLTINVPR